MISKVSSESPFNVVLTICKTTGSKYQHNFDWCVSCHIHPLNLCRIKEKTQKNIHLYYILTYGGEYINCYSLCVHKHIRYTSSDTKFVEMTLLEVETLGIQDL